MTESHTLPEVIHSDTVRQALRTVASMSLNAAQMRVIIKIIRCVLFHSTVHLLLPSYVRKVDFRPKTSTSELKTAFIGSVCECNELLHAV